MSDEISTKALSDLTLISKPALKQGYFTQPHICLNFQSAVESLRIETALTHIHFLSLLN